MRQCFCAVVSATAVTLIMVAAMHNLNPKMVETITRHGRNKTVIRIVSWTQRFATQKGPWFAEGSQEFEACELPEGASCEYWHDRERHSASDVTLFAVSRLQEEGIPTYRRPDQLWVLHNMESPAHPAFNKNLAKYNGLFNISTSYLDKADITMRHGECVKKRDPNGQRSFMGLAANKTELVAWLVSNCHAQNRRMEYAKQLQKYIPVHIYGKCGETICVKGRNSSCNKLLKQKYRFYLAFENSLCREYITEKFWRSFTLDVVPVVLGGANYKEVAPPHSFIDVRDFASPKHLAKYLVYLQHNDTAYNEYFKWKDNYQCEWIRFSHFPCKLCQFLHQRRTAHAIKVSSVDIAETWSKDEQCQSAEDFRNQCHCWP